MTATARRSEVSRPGRPGGALPLAVASLGVGIPVSAIALSVGEGGGIVALLVAWSGIVGVNWAYSRR